MEKFEGKSILKGVAIGKIHYYSKGEQVVQRVSVEDTEAELQRYETAKETALEQLHELYEKALKEVGEVNAAIFDVHAMMLEDDDFNDSIRNTISSQKVNAEYAVATTGDNFAKMFEEMDDEYFRARSADIKDISERVVSVLHGATAKNALGDEPVILAAKDLAPSETVQMDKTKLLGFVTEFGSSNSHTAILARTMNIPALIGIPVDEKLEGRTAVIDGVTATLILDPDEETLKLYQEKKQEEERQRELLQELKGKEDVTLDGKHIRLYANIGSVGDTAKVLANDADGIGLFRSEFLYLEKSDYPTEEEQFQAYKTVAQNMAGKKVIIRTLDIGADKQVDYFHLDHEDNPAMGYRAIRICLDREEIFRTQLRAILRASAYGNIGIMYPMIISVDEVRKCREILEQVRRELERQDIPVGEIEQGIMIETPAAAMISDLLAEEVDFFSIGTNDLTQYTLAIDRQNAKLDSIYDSHHPAVLRMIRMVVENGHKSGCWVGICGELGADTTLTGEFLRMGIDELSVTPASVLPIRKIIRESTVK
ncbi:MAG TPA: phosphoenolpyruvate--protein phosphotransferase [Candidatus Fusicatenibacter intestinigallinarum]|mgnify:FL=1|uniref:Phosphoenolpyruvate-protein phosphotransferase n=1 Tax=Candidatus Fusicatenibacter intestinigallinarum TaxID=2838598 RepID=A0A9D2N9E9_9FIRM|nr:phosphoenolpyruvate--protein phosphotransferase [Candidatus Fusicatenibacter intestinigallinarum]